MSVLYIEDSGIVKNATFKDMIELVVDESNNSDTSQQATKVTGRFNILIQTSKCETFEAPNFIYFACIAI